MPRIWDVSDRGQLPQPRPDLTTDPEPQPEVESTSNVTAVTTALFVGSVTAMTAIDNAGPLLGLMNPKRWGIF